MASTAIEALKLILGLLVDKSFWKHLVAFGIVAAGSLWWGARYVNAKHIDVAGRLEKAEAQVTQLKVEAAATAAALPLIQQALTSIQAGVGAITQQAGETNKMVLDLYREVYKPVPRGQTGASIVEPEPGGS